MRDEASACWAAPGQALNMHGFPCTADVRWRFRRDSTCAGLEALGAVIDLDVETETICPGRTNWCWGHGDFSGGRIFGSTDAGDRPMWMSGRRAKGTTSSNVRHAASREIVEWELIFNERGARSAGGEHRA